MSQAQEKVIGPPFDWFVHARLTEDGTAAQLAGDKAAKCLVAALWGVLEAVEDAPREVQVAVYRQMSVMWDDHPDFNWRWRP